MKKRNNLFTCIILLVLSLFIISCQNEAPNVYSVYFVINDEGLYVTQEVKEGEIIQIPGVAEREGYYLDGWYLDPALTEEYVSSPVSQGMTLYAEWKRIELTVTFETNGGTSIPSIPLKYGDVVSMPANPQKEEYNFAGWFIDSELTIPFVSTDPITEDVILYAKWDSIPYYTVEFDLQSDAEEIPSQRIPEGGFVSRPQNPTLQGRIFKGWSEHSWSSSYYDFSTPVTSDMTLYAQWQFERYSVKFDPQNGEDPTYKNVYYGDRVSKPSTDPVREGATFLGWYTEDGEEFDFNSSVTGDINLFAHWDVSQFTVTFKLDDGIPTDADGEFATDFTEHAITVEYGSKIELPDVTLMYEDMKVVFSGWYYEDSKIEFNPESATVKTDLVLEARWAGYALSEDGQTYYVYNAEGLEAWRLDVFKNLDTNCTLIADITMGSVGTYQSNWSGTYEFNGVFEGNGHTIYGIQMVTRNQNYVTEFISVNNGEIRNLHLDGMNASNDAGGGIWGLCSTNNGLISGCSIMNSDLDAGSDSTSTAAAMAGVNNGIIIGCYIGNTSVSARYYVGGLVGTNYADGQIIGCVAYMEDSDLYVVGSTRRGCLAFKNNGTIDSCYYGPTSYRTWDNSGDINAVRISNSFTEEEITSLNNAIDAWNVEHSGKCDSHFVITETWPNIEIVKN